MLDAKLLDDIAKKLLESVPSALNQVKQDLEKNFKSVLQGAFTKLDLVTREEFDTQQKVLQRTRHKLEVLEAELMALQSRKTQEGE